MRGYALVALLTLAFGACGRDAERFCELGQEYEVARVSNAGFDGLSLVAVGDGAVALWSEASGLFARRLTSGGRARGGAVRLGPRCGGGMAATRGSATIRVGCVTAAGGGPHSSRRSVMLYAVGDDLSLGSVQRLGEAGGLGDGVAVARMGDADAVAWHDASVDASRVMWMAPTLERGRTVSDGARLASAPSLLARQSSVRAVWAERWLEQGELRSRILHRNGDGTVTTVLDGAHLEAMPQLVSLDDQVLVAFRDRRKGARRTGLYVRRLGPEGRPRGEPVRVGRADGVARPALEPCLDGLVVATPRTFGGDYFVGINWLDAELRQPRGEQQFYEDSHAFGQAAVACLGQRALVLIAERGELHGDGTALRAVPYDCR